VYAVVESGKPTILTAALIVFFQESLFHATPSALEKSGADGNLSFVWLTKNARVVGGSLILLSPFPLSNFITKQPFLVSRLPTNKFANAPGLKGISDSPLR
jgi:hypothetical protein